MKEGIAVLNDEVVSAINNPSVVQLLEHDISLLTLFGTSECRLNKQIKSLAYALDETKNRLTDKLEKELTEWNSLAYDAKEVRLRAIKQIDFHEILKADVTLKRYTLYLTTQISELMTTE
ncbi:DUF2959 domain-containing protein [Caenorhabditis elegans]|nr:DUF2959 domain-containing protein [Caenorhabditis elegans]CAR97853.1 DUF2959 domain-containing protein [Caenorhabditis elegans]|eukprot:NP_001257135.1 Uncharacterized protein CELE_W02H3.1 [Caenorhabditis elegans]